ncbi:MAG TPA: extracellular solute-binding protein [Chloroflexota bacterium]|jgi:multiple sugar transport system substrate-binding protein
MQPASVSRRRLIGLIAAASALPLAVACGATAPAATSVPAKAAEAPKPTEAAKPAQPAAAPPATSAKPGGSLAGTKLTVLTGNSFVPAQDKLVDNMVADLGQQTGMDAKVERPGAQMAAKIATIIESGAGGDIAIMADTDPFLYGDKLADVSEIANEIDKAWGGWYDVAKQSCIVDGKWRALSVGHAPCAWNYRTDMFKAAGVDKFPDTFDELTEAAAKLHAKGTPMGMTLGHAGGDGRSTNYPVLWAHGGKEFQKDGRTVALESPETLKSIEWYVKIFKYLDPASLAWLDPDNNQAFLAGKVSAMTNVNTVYLAARDAAATDPEKKKLIENMDHANWPSGPAGRVASHNINLWAGFGNSKNRDGQFAFFRGWFDKKFLVPYTKVGQSYFIPPLADIEKEDAWPDDPKLKIFRELNKINRVIGWEGPPTRAVAEMVSKFVLVDMYAQAVTGKMTPTEAMKWAANEYKQAAAKL